MFEQLIVAKKTRPKGKAAGALIVTLLCLGTATAFAESSPTQQSSAATANAGKEIKYYKSTMIPGEVSQDPGKDSMGMEMVPVYEGDDDSASAAIKIDPVTQQNMGIRTAIVTTGSLRRQLRTFGTFDYNETAMSDVTTRMPGWIERLYADATGKEVHAGEPLLDLFSPEFLEAQAEFLATPNVPSTSTFSSEDARRGARMRLRVLGVTDEQIERLEKERKALRDLRVVAPRSGVIVEKTAVQGMRTDGNERLFRIADLSSVWLMAQVYERDLPFVRLGQEAVASLSYYPDRTFRGRITFISPSLDAKTRTAMVRIEFHNPSYLLKPQMFANVMLESVLKPSAILIPDMAILRSGERTTAFVALEGGRFEPREIHLGVAGDNDMHEVLHGLNPGERVVTSAQFLLDSESQLREAIQKMLSPIPASGEHAGHTAQATTAGLSGQVAPEPSPAAADEVAYVCPMPEHASITYKAPGKCPICGMALVPVTGDQLPKLQEMPQALYYTCPMPEHSDVRSTTPGKCPRCGMTLIPVTQKTQEQPPSERYGAAETSSVDALTTAATTEAATTSAASGGRPASTPASTDPHAGHKMP